MNALHPEETNSRRRLWPMLALLVLVSCAGPAQRLDDQATGLGFQRMRVEGAGFGQIVYDNADWPSRGVLHVYLAGDGRPWRHRHQVAADPTPGHSLVLELMALDPAPALYLGRPCYQGLVSEPRCTPSLWTSDRYSATVVDSMAAALHRLLEHTGRRGLVFIGHSGGGTLAMLLAARFPETRAVVTLAGNLDTQAWAREHGYAPLTGSLNPAEQPPLDPAIRQIHLAGGQDHNIPAGLIRQALRTQPDPRFEVIEGFDHRCCWPQVWPRILERLASDDQGNNSSEIDVDQSMESSPSSP